MPIRLFLLPRNGECVIFNPLNQFDLPLTPKYPASHSYDSQGIRSLVKEEYRLAAHLKGIFKGPQTRLGRLYQHRHIARFVLIAQHLHMRLGQVVPGEHFGHARIQTALQHQLVGR